MKRKKNSPYKWKAFISDVLKPDKAFTELLGEHETIESKQHIRTENYVVYSSYIAKTDSGVFVKATYKMNSNEYGISGFYTTIEIVGNAKGVDVIEKNISDYIDSMKNETYTIYKIYKRDI